MLLIDRILGNRLVRRLEEGVQASEKLVEANPLALGVLDCEVVAGPRANRRPVDARDLDRSASILIALCGANSIPLAERPHVPPYLEAHESNADGK